ncbi:MAG: hypothetical protein U9R36_05255, partial [Elusimicrobiota bacterium]|nr:hypothetical protein [Elusimicrobiota bacterium]
IRSRGQTTIPKEIREVMNLTNDKIVYVPDGKRVFMLSISGNILDTYGAFSGAAKEALDYKKLRKKVKKKISEKIIKETE